MSYVPPEAMTPVPFPTPEGDDQTNCPWCGQIADRAGAGWQCREIAAHAWAAPVPPTPPPDAPVRSGFWEQQAEKEREDRERERAQRSS
jgi:hypothetical protein